MKQIIKFFLIIFFNIIFIYCLFYCIELIIYKIELKKYNQNPTLNTIQREFKHVTYFPDYMINLRQYYTGKNNMYAGRLPDGTEYKGNKPIVIFGCSYGFGEYLNYDQTFSYKLAKQLKRPVFNCCITGGGFTQMYLHTQKEEFYEDITPTDEIIYVAIDDHFRRMYLQYFSMLDYHILPLYNLRNGQLEPFDYNNKFKNFIRSLYIVKHFNHIHSDYYVHNKKNEDKIINLALIYFIKTREILEKKWNKKIKFSIILYETPTFTYKEKFKTKLEENNFYVISTSELTKENLMDEKYMMLDNFHPKESAWDLLTPLIIDNLRLKSYK